MLFVGGAMPATTINHHTLTYLHSMTTNTQGASWERELLMMDDQPCGDFEEAETSPMTNEAVPHECPDCGGTRYFCKNCSSDHHKDGWKLCFVRTLLSKERAEGDRRERGKWMLAIMHLPSEARDRIIAIRRHPPRRQYRGDY